MDTIPVAGYLGLLYFGSEFLLGLVKRAKAGTTSPGDRGSLRVLWVVADAGDRGVVDWRVVESVQGTAVDREAPVDARGLHLGGERVPLRGRHDRSSDPTPAHTGQRMRAASPGRPVVGEREVPDHRQTVGRVLDRTRRHRRHRRHETGL